MTGDPAGSREVAGNIAIAGHGVLVEILPEGLTERFNPLALVRTVGAEALATVKEATNLLSEVPSLGRFRRHRSSSCARPPCERRIRREP